MNKISQKILFLKGLPASGKSTFAQDLVSRDPDRWVRVNKDSLRDLLHEGKWSRGREKIVQKMERAMVEQALTAGLSVIVDNTHLSPKHEQTYEALAEKFGVEFEIKSFDISIEECIARDSKREKHVGKDVILRMFYQFLCKPLASVDSEEVKYLTPAVIVDIDGTLAIHNNRSPFDWDKVDQDSINKNLLMVLRALKISGHTILLVSGRDSCCRELTEQWLKKHDVPYSHLWMRPEKDNQKDTVIKKELFDRHIRGNYNVVAVFDDRPSVVRFWRSEGLFVFDCGNGVEF